jgi:hypothetical protein
MKLQSILVSALFAALVTAMASASANWEKLRIETCDGPVDTVRSERVKISKTGWDVTSRDPECIGTFGDVRDQSKILSRASICEEIVVKVPRAAKVCAIRYYMSESGGHDKQLRKTPTHNPIGHSFARMYPAVTRVVGAQREINATFENWQKSKSRYGWLEVDLQR